MNNYRYDTKYTVVYSQLGNHGNLFFSRPNFSFWKYRGIYILTFGYHRYIYLFLF